MWGRYGRSVPPSDPPADAGATARGGASTPTCGPRLAAVTKALPGGEERAGQVDMAVAVGRAIADKRPLIVQAGTGTGKSLAYLVPAIVSGVKVVVATATKALQDQLAGKDLPFLTEHLDRPFTFAVLKGRSNYVCLQRVHEAESDVAQGTLDGTSDTTVTEEVRAPGRVGRHHRAPATGPSSTSSRRSGRGRRSAWGRGSAPGPPTARRARRASPSRPAPRRPPPTWSWSTPTSTASTSRPEEPCCPSTTSWCIDEAHQFEDVVSATFGLELFGGRFTNLARITAAILADPASMADLEQAAAHLSDALADQVGRRLPRGHGPGPVRRARLRPGTGRGRAGQGARRARRRARRRRGPQAAGPQGGGHPARRPRLRRQRSRQPRGLGRGQRRQPGAAGGPGRRGRGPARRVVGGADGGAHQRHHPRPAGRAVGTRTGGVRRARRREPLRLRAPRPAVLRGAPPRPPPRRLRRRVPTPSWRRSSSPPGGAPSPSSPATGP